MKNVRRGKAREEKEKSEKQSERTEIKQDFRTEMEDEVQVGCSVTDPRPRFGKYPPAPEAVPLPQAGPRRFSGV